MSLGYSSQVSPKHEIDTQKYYGVQLGYYHNELTSH